MAPPFGPRLLLASTSPQRRAILQQLRLPFDVVAPRYEEHDPPDADPFELVRNHASGKARSVIFGDTIAHKVAEKFVSRVKPFRT